MKFIKIAFVFLTFFIFPKNADAHKFYTSITLMEYNATNKLWEITMNVFVDDFEKAISKENKRPVNLLNGKEDFLIMPYLKKHFNISVNGKKSQNITFIGTELKSGTLTIYLELKANSKQSQIIVFNGNLLSEFDDQVNFVNLKYLDQAKSLVFKKNSIPQDIKW